MAFNCSNAKCTNTDSLCQDCWYLFCYLDRSSKKYNLQINLLRDLHKRFKLNINDTNEIYTLINEIINNNHCPTQCLPCGNLDESCFGLTKFCTVCIYEWEIMGSKMVSLDKTNSIIKRLVNNSEEIAQYLVECDIAYFELIDKPSDKICEILLDHDTYPQRKCSYDKLSELCKKYVKPPLKNDKNMYSKVLSSKPSIKIIKKIVSEFGELLQNVNTSDRTHDIYELAVKNCPDAIKFTSRKFKKAYYAIPPHVISSKGDKN